MTSLVTDLNPGAVHNFLQCAVAPRPICLASTIDKSGNVNLSPFSFFNVFSSNPPILIFSPSRRMRDNTTKHTLENVAEVNEVVINIVDYEMVQQVSLSSCEFPKKTDEFSKAGFTPEKATLVRPPLVKESKIKFECGVLEIKPLGTMGGAGNLVICEVLCMHIDDSILGLNNEIDQTKINHVARLGGDWYCSINETNLFKVAKPNVHIGIGVDNLPDIIRESYVFTPNNLAQLANVSAIPAIDPIFHSDKLKNIIQYYAIDPVEMDGEIQQYAKELLDEGKVNESWQVLSFYALVLLK